MSDKTVAEETAEYVRQIIIAVQQGDEPEYMVTELLKEFGAKAFRQGQQILVERITKLVG